MLVSQRVNRVIDLNHLDLRWHQSTRLHRPRPLTWITVDCYWRFASMSIHIEKHIGSRIQSYSVLLLVGGLEHGVYDFPYIGNVIIPTDELIFFRGVETTNQNMYEPDVNPFNHITTSRLEVLERTSPKISLPITVESQAPRWPQWWIWLATAFEFCWFGWHGSCCTAKLHPGAMNHSLVERWNWGAGQGSFARW